MMAWAMPLPRTASSARHLARNQTRFASGAAPVREDAQPVAAAAKLGGDGPAHEPCPASNGDRQGVIGDAGGGEDGVDRRGPVAEQPLQGRPDEEIVERR